MLATPLGAWQPATGDAIGGCLVSVAEVELGENALGVWQRFVHFRAISDGTWYVLVETCYRMLNITNLESKRSNRHTAARQHFSQRCQVEP